MGTSYAAISDIRAWGANGVGLTTAQASDADVTNWLEIASRIIDGYTGRQKYGFGGLVQDVVTVSDVRNPLVALPTPYSGVTQVTANGMVFGATASSTVQASPAPTTTVFNVAAGDGAKFLINRSTVVGQTQGVILSVSGDTVTLAAPLASAPTAGSAVTQFPWTLEDWGIRLYIPGFLDVDGFPRRASTPIGYGWRAGSPYGSQIQVVATFGYATVPTKVKAACILVTSHFLQNRGEQMYAQNVLAVMVEGYQVRYKPHDGNDVLMTTGVLEADKLLQEFRLDMVQVG